MITVSYLKRLTNAAFGWLQAFRMYGGIGMSASSLHRESTDSLISLWDSSTEATHLVSIANNPIEFDYIGVSELRHDGCFLQEFHFLALV